MSEQRTGASEGRKRPGLASTTRRHTRKARSRASASISPASKRLTARKEREAVIAPQDSRDVLRNIDSSAPDAAPLPTFAPKSEQSPRRISRSARKTARSAHGSPRIVGAKGRAREGGAHKGIAERAEPQVKRLRPPTKISAARRSGGGIRKAPLRGAAPPAVRHEGRARRVRETLGARRKQSLQPSAERLSPRPTAKRRDARCKRPRSSRNHVPSSAHPEASPATGNRGPAPHDLVGSKSPPRAVTITMPPKARLLRLEMATSNLFYGEPTEILFDNGPEFCPEAVTRDLGERPSWPAKKQGIERVFKTIDAKVGLASGKVSGAPNLTLRQFKRFLAKWIVKQHFRLPPEATGVSPSEAWLYPERNPRRTPASTSDAKQLPSAFRSEAPATAGGRSRALRQSARGARRAPRRHPRSAGRGSDL
jgi:hypothetical protein